MSHGGGTSITADMASNAHHPSGSYVSGPVEPAAQLENANQARKVLSQQEGSRGQEDRVTSSPVYVDLSQVPEVLRAARQAQVNLPHCFLPEGTKASQRLQLAHRALNSCLSLKGSPNRTVDDLTPMIQIFFRDFSTKEIDPDVKDAITICLAWTLGVPDAHKLRDDLLNALRKL